MYQENIAEIMCGKKFFRDCLPLFVFVLGKRQRQTWLNQADEGDFKSKTNSDPIESHSEPTKQTGKCEKERKRVERGEGREKTNLGFELHDTRPY